MRTWASHLTVCLSFLSALISRLVLSPLQYSASEAQLKLRTKDNPFCLTQTFPYPVAFWRDYQWLLLYVSSWFLLCLYAPSEGWQDVTSVDFLRPRCLKVFRLIDNQEIWVMVLRWWGKSEFCRIQLCSISSPNDRLFGVSSLILAPFQAVDKSFWVVYPKPKTLKWIQYGTMEEALDWKMAPGHCSWSFL